MSIVTRSTHRCFGGTQGFYSHHSETNQCTMRFAVYLPPQAEQGPVPALYYLSGLTCTEENFVIKAGAQRIAAQLGLALAVCDTSPRGLGLPGETDAIDFGEGASYYLDATVAPYAQHYRMGSYVAGEFVDLIERHFAVCNDKRGILGHSMGGHGAMVAALRNPGRWQSLSALAPVTNPSAGVRRQGLLARYLGTDPTAWQQWDTCALLQSGKRFDGEILVDQGLADEMITALNPDALEAAACDAGQALRLRRYAGYDHGYFFVQSFIEDHLRHHARALGVTA